MKSRWRLLGSVGGFGASVVISGLVSLATIPFIISHTGQDGWSSVAVGQSLGALVGIFTLLGWSQSGPTEVARNESNRGQYFFESLRIRALFLLPAAVVVGVFAYLLQTTSEVATFLIASSILVCNLGASWFYVGERNPTGLLIYDTMPRSLSVVAASVAVAMGSGVVVYALIVISGAIVAVGASSVNVYVRYGCRSYGGVTPRRTIEVLRAQRHGVGTAVLSTAYLQAPLLVLQHLLPVAVPLYALVDKIKQQALTAYRPVSQVIQGWTPSGGEDAVTPRVKRVTRFLLVTSLLGSVSFAVVLPIAARVLADSIVVDTRIVIPFALAFGMNILSLSVGVACLLPLGLERHITASAAIGTACIAVSLVPMILLSGAVGAAWAVATSQSFVALYQLFALRRGLRMKGVSTNA